MAISVANLLMVKAANAQTATPTPTPPTITQTTVVNDSLELSMSVDKTVFEVGEPVDITLVVTNISNQTVDYETSPVWQMMLRFIISNGTNSSIYQFFPNQPMPMIMGPET
ncbi:MAG TPA: hypothetical protein VLV84_02675, partial [Candidatus Acidoferrales bacterium]|nr:hypothetical protein [Candidatus Acidoferrales bacterium]